MITPESAAAIAPTHKLVDMCGEEFCTGTESDLRRAADEWEEADAHTFNGAGIRVVPMNARWDRPSMSYDGRWVV